MANKDKLVQEFQRGMEAGAKPFEEKFQQHAKELKKSKQEIMYQINEIADVQNELLDIEEEHEEKIKRIEEKVQYGLKDKETLTNLGKGEKEVLGGLLVELSKDFEFNEKQKQFTSNIFRILGISNPQSIAYDVIDNVESITTQRTLYRIITEVMFLENSNSNFSKDVQEILDYFSISTKQILKRKQRISIKQLVKMG